ncbi:serine hydrolase [Streptomyces sp. Ru72]|uniref:serine hydrolase domain-containing protein n=1 Tax=Streptomyces sp. Ru72 TaxID=2080747 RepID=UPI001C67086C|nr:serine hydrolase domain-containing protein [Streptomyces sp. Ru72]
MSQDKLSEFVKAQATELGVPGAAVGVLLDGQEIYVSHGVTSLSNPLPVDEKTLFPAASVSKTFTATALMRLIAEEKVDLDAPVRRYVPELKLADEQAAGQITVLNLLNHTAGLDWNLIDDGEGDRSLAGLVAKLPQLPLIAPPGTRASYSQAGYNLAGRIVEKVTDLPFERAMASLVLEPVGLADTVYGLSEVMVRKFAVGYNRGDDGELRPARPWGAFKEGARGDNPGGGLASSVSDLLRWARFHLGDGEGVLPAAELHRMREQTVELRAARSATASASAGSCATWTAYTGSAKAARVTASSPNCSSCPSATSRWSPWPTSARTAIPSTSPSYGGHSSTTSASSRRRWSRSHTTRNRPNRSSAATRSTP